MSDPYEGLALRNGDYIYLYQTSSHFTISISNPQNGKQFSIESPGQNSTLFMVQAYLFNSNGQLITPVAGTGYLSPGMFIRFMPTTSSYMATGSLNDVIYRSGTPSSGQVEICSNDTSGEDTGFGLWSFVTPGCQYDFKKDYKQRIYTEPIYYNKDYFLQNIGQQICNINNQNVFMFADSTDSGTGNISLDATAITATDCPQDELGNYFWRAISVNDDMSINLAALHSGYYFSVINAANGLMVFQQDLGDTEGATGVYGFDGGHDEVGPGDVYSTFVVKKVNIINNTFYSSDDPDGIIYPGDLVCFFGKGPGGENGMVFTADEPVPSIIAGLTSQNNVVNKTDVTVYNGSNGCGKDGSFFSLWMFVEIDGSGNATQGGPSLSRPVQYGRHYFVESYGQYYCFNVTQKILGGSVYWVQVDTAGSGGTPNFNCTTIDGDYPNQPGSNDGNDADWQFFMVTTDGGINFDNAPPLVNDCSNCVDDCNVDECCGCDIARDPNDWWSWWYLIIIIIFIIIFIVILLLILKLVFKII